MPLVVDEGYSSNPQPTLSTTALSKQTKMAFKLVVLSCLLAVARGSVVPAVTYAAAAPIVAAPAVAKLEEFDPLPQYRFGYNVADTLTGDFKSQQEERNGDLVRGSYSLVEADGTRRIVDYAADSVNGFNAVVRKEPLVAAAPAVVEEAVVPARFAAEPVVARYAAAPVSPVYSTAFQARYAPSQYFARYAEPVFSRYAAPINTAYAEPVVARYAAEPVVARYAQAPVVAEPVVARYAQPQVVAEPVVARYAQAPLVAEPFVARYPATPVATEPVVARYATAPAFSARYAAPVVGARYAAPAPFNTYAAPAKFVEAAPAAGYRYP